ncbi:hypothetical protein QYF61_000630 [Mycteria americana]|uniref:GOLD domain-containing protein n=1 Tax=Mycteria americana TaxID=33587 RepID=A0AAN7RWL4_MYCAM|nr:hypothetical protein QYF61_000630 [Mycteria americana]
MGPLPWPRQLLLPLGCFALLLPPPGAAEFSPSLDSDFTFTLPAGRKECFYQPMRKEASLELEYQVGQGRAAWLRGRPGSPREGEGPPRGVVLKGAGRSRILPRRRRCRSWAVGGAGRFGSRFLFAQARLHQRRRHRPALLPGASSRPPGVPHPSPRPRLEPPCGPPPARPCERQCLGRQRDPGALSPSGGPGDPAGLPQPAAAAGGRPAARTSRSGQGARPACGSPPRPAGLGSARLVLDGAGLDVDFHLLSPKGETLVFDERKSDGVHTVETEDGDYMFCFDNTFSTISEKVIFFELILDNMGEDGQDQEDWKKYVTGTDLLDMKLEDILESINSVKTRLSKSVQIQTLLRAFEARDRNIQESNFDRVNFWSMVNLGVMVVVLHNSSNTAGHLFYDLHPTQGLLHYTKRNLLLLPASDSYHILED